MAVPDIAAPGMTGGPEQTIGFFDTINDTSTTFTAADITVVYRPMGRTSPFAPGVFIARR
mgnify:CR=1 FL=1